MPESSGPRRLIGDLRKIVVWSVIGIVVWWSVRTLASMFVVFFIASQGCEKAEPVVIHSAISPDSALFARTEEINPGALSPYVYEIYVGAVADTPRLGTLVFAAYMIDEPKIEWK